MKKLKYVLLSSLLLVSTLFTGCKNQDLIMIIGVQPDDEFDEIGILISALDYRNQEEIDGINFYTGKIGKKHVVIAQSPVGTSEAAMTTTIGIKQFHPKYVINEGSAGGHHENINVNDIVLGKDILDMVSYQGPADDPSLWEGEYNGLLHPPLHSDANLLKIASKVTNPKVGNIKADGIVSSGDCWNEGVDFVNKLHDRFNEDCEEMESYAVTNVCKNYNIPMLTIRAISNNLITGDEYQTEPGQNCQYYVMDVIKAI